MNTHLSADTEPSRTRTKTCKIHASGSRWLSIPLWVCVGTIIVLGLVDAWAGRRSYAAGDSVSYMDMASKLSTGQLSAAANSIWSPLYPMFLAPLIHVAGNNAVLEFTIVRLANFIIFIMAIIAFRYFVTRLLLISEPDCGYSQAVRSWIWLNGYLLFAWACMFLNLVCRVSPDTMVTVFFLLLSAQLLNFGVGEVSAKRFLLYGLTLGGAYWCKEIFVTLVPFFLSAPLLFLAVRRVKRRLALTLLALIIVTSPLIAGLTLKYGYFNFGMSGPLNYAWHVNGVLHWFDWQGGPAGSGIPLHPTTILHKNPDAFAFISPIDATYAPWYDPGYWYAGVTPRLSPNQQVLAIAHNLKVLIGILKQSRTVLALLIILVIAASVLRQRAASVLNQFCRTASLWLLCLFTVAIYLLVHIEARYLSAPLAILALLSLVTFVQPALQANRGLKIVVSLLLAIGVFADVGSRLYPAGKLLVQTRGDVRDSTWRVRDEFMRLNVPAGTPVAAIGEACFTDWARLAHLRIVADIPYSLNEIKNPGIDRYWASTHHEREDVLRGFQRVGAQFVVANHVPQWADTSDWVRIGNSEYYYQHLSANVSHDSNEAMQRNE